MLHPLRQKRHWLMDLLTLIRKVLIHAFEAEIWERLYVCVTACYYKAETSRSGVVASFITRIHAVEKKKKKDNLAGTLVRENRQ